MACQIRVIKILHYTFIVIFVLYGLAIFFSAVSSDTNTNYVENLGGSTSSSSTMTVIVSIVIIVVACLGFYGAYRENYNILMTFVGLLIALVILHMFITICVFVASGYIDDVDFKTKYRAHFIHYNDSQQQRNYVNVIQKGLQCCGVDNSDDFQKILGIDIPGSCCGKGFATKFTCSKDESYERGCVLALKKIIQTVFTTMGGIAIGIVVIEMIGVAFALWLAISIKNSEHTNDSV
ncbi:CD63 antigen-like [Monomorium pharaonis]|uniref:CD63 antigen-like n=1 Tax=Monomorium pharaonis TaxID=307658 RepID=UPI001746F05B|nr:CD63 antigen-like [Monomorium pharaonis]